MCRLLSAFKYFKVIYIFTIFKGTDILYIVQVVLEIRKGKKACWVSYRAMKIFITNPRKKLWNQNYQSQLWKNMPWF